MDADFDSVFTLRLRLRAAQNEISSLRSGQAYVRMVQEYQQQLRTQDREIIRLRKEVGNANATVVTMREHWTAEAYCDALSIIESGKSSGSSAYRIVKTRFE